MKRTNYKGKDQKKRNGKDASKGKDRFDKRNVRDKVDRDNEGKRHNDDSWHNKHLQLTADAGNIAFTWPLGYPLDIRKGTENSDNIYVPGICVLRTAPSFGVTTGLTSPVNIAARNIYSFIRHANSGAKNYDAPDLMLYLLAVDSLYSMYATMVRIYGLAQLYSQRNRYFPKSMIDAMGVTFESVMNNLANFRYFINQYALKLSALCIPAFMDYYNRHMWLYSNIFADSPSAKAQYYIYVPQILYLYNEKAEGGGRLDAIQVLNRGFGNLKPITELMNTANIMLEAVLSSEDATSIIAGDILKAFGQNNLITVPEIGENYTVNPIYSEDDLTQIQNTTVFSVGKLNEASLAKWNVTQIVDIADPNAGALIYDPEFNPSVGDYATPAASWCGNRLVASDSDSPDPINVLRSTTMTVMCIPVLEGEQTVPVTVRFRSTGSETVVNGEIYFFNKGRLHFTTLAYMNGFTSVSDAAGVISRIANSSYFHKHPAMFAVQRTGTNDWIHSGYFNDMNDYALLQGHDLDKMHEADILSLFNVPYLGA